MLNNVDKNYRDRKIYHSLKTGVRCALLTFTFLFVLRAQAYATSAVSNICNTAVGTIAPGQTTPLGCPKTNLPTDGSGPAPTRCETAPEMNWTSPEQYENAIRTKWGIDFRPGFTLDQMQMIWQEFYTITCTGFLQDIKGTRLARWGNVYSQQFSCPQDGDINVYFGEHHGDFVRALITHELTHVWQHCSRRGEVNRLEVPPVYNSEGGVSNYSRTGCGYASGYESLIKEDHADTIALYLNRDIGELTCGGGAGNPFADNRHPAHAALAKRGLGR